MTDARTWVGRPGEGWGVGMDDREGTHTADPKTDQFFRVS